MTHYTREYCEQLDQQDALAQFRDEFALPEDVIYLDGNSLGARPKKSLERAHQVVENQWGNGLIKSWNDADWWRMPQILGDKIARIVGANAGEVVVTDSTSINLYKVLSAALEMRPERSVIVMWGSNFPTDNYAVQGLLKHLGGKYEIRFVEEDNVMDAIDETVAAVSLTHVHYKTGYVLDMQAITEKAHAVGALAIWDLCHSAGAMEVDLNGCLADFAVGCTYKYLNGGPGGPAFLFAAKRHQGEALQTLTGWWGHTDPFAFERDYRPAEGIRQMLTGTQPILSLMVAEVGVDIFLRTDMALLRKKSEQLTNLFIELIDQRCGQHGFTLVSPREAKLRGSQVSLNHDDGYPIMKALISQNVIGDFRAPKNIRFGFTPLYIRHVDVWDAVERLRMIMENEVWRQPEFHEKSAVT